MPTELPAEGEIDRNSGDHAMHMAQRARLVGM